MAKNIAFSIWDVKAEAFSPPYFFPAIGQGIRLFSDWCHDASHPCGRHPSDYRLYRVGEFDDNSGDLGGQQPVQLVSGDEIMGTEGNLGQKVKVQRA